MSRKKLTKSSTNKKVSGVLAGIGSYFNLDPSLIRLAFIVLAIVTAVIPCVIGYFLADWILPKDSEV
jgi:phage shock protein C